MKKSFFLYALLFLSLNISFSQVSDSDVLLTISDEPVLATEFIRVYNKNLDLVQDDSQKEVESYLKLFLNYKLKLAEAKSLGYDKDLVYLKELKTYQNQLTQNYLTDKNVTEELVLEAYERTVNEVKAQHVLVRVENFETDTLQAFNDVLAFKDRLKNENFDSLKKEIHDGKNIFVEDLGFFTAFKMAYNFESKAFNTKIGEVSNPFRTKFGYHVVKVLDKRKSKGLVSVSHIMIANTQKDNKLVAKDRILELHRLLVQGEDFGALAKQFSDDKSSSARNGELKPFKSGQINSTKFENTAFSLKEIGDISEPIQTKFGWHILKLIKKTPVDDFNKIKNDLQKQVGKDSRSKLVRTKMFEKLLSEYNLSKKNQNLVSFQTEVVFDVSNRNWDLSNKINNTKIFLQIKDRSYTYRDFIDFLNKNSKSINKKWKKKFIIENQYKLFLEQLLFQYKKDNLEYENQEFANILNEYREGLLLFELMQDKIWEGAKNDTLGLKVFYNNNMKNYLWPDRIIGSIASSSSYKTIKKVRKSWLNNHSNDKIDKLLNTRKQNVIFSKGEFELGDPPLPKNLILSKHPITGVIKENNNFFVVKIDEFVPESQKTILEAKGQLISDYQNELESRWILELKSKFHVDLNEEVFQKVKSIISK
ncbi:MAG: peptidylprolyl isomerase [Formosa sp.]|jgi:peptidyl-prolyl cis-trans isomerase SurA|nr:peptidylprolyl isomerase [Formosa sp.]